MASELVSKLFQSIGGTINKPKRKVTRNYTPIELRALRRCLVYACENVTNLTALCTQLIQDNVISQDDYEEIFNTQHTDRKKMMQIIKLVSKKGAKALEKFLAALRRDNDHILDRITEEENNLRQNNDEDEDSDEGIVRQLKKKKKKGKLFSVYAASDSDDSDSDEEIDFNDENPDINQLLTFLLLMEYYVRKLHYYHRRTPYIMQRFNKAPQNYVFPETRFQKSFQCFKVNRAVFLEKVGFYGPKNISIASYQVKVTLSIWNPSVFRSIPVIENEELVEVRSGQIMYVYLSKTELPQPIRPHTWHAIHFTIKGEDAMEVQAPENKLRRNTVTYDQVEEGVSKTPNNIELFLFDKVKFEFHTCSLLSTCQLPELCFYRGKERLSTGIFPKLGPITKKQKKKLFTK